MERGIVPTGTPQTGTPPPGGDITLAGLLNVLWRRRWIVVGIPLLALAVAAVYIAVAPRMYKATATVRPGITAFTPEGFPVRDWRLKDVTRWFDEMLYRRPVVERLELDPRARPVIRAEFIAQGLQNLEGGDVITLTTFAPDPELAREILNAAIDGFSEYAEEDSLSSNIQLSRRGLRLRMARLRNEAAGLESEAEHVVLKLGAAAAESLQIESEAARIELNIRDLEVLSERSRSNLGALARQQAALERDLEDIGEVMTRLRQEPGSSVDPQEIPGWLDRDAVLTGPDVFSNLVESRSRLQQKLMENAVHQDSLRTAIDRNAIGVERLVLARDRDVAARRLTVHQKIGELRLETRFRLPLQAEEIENRVREAQVQFGSLTPLERIGRISVSDEPVRPRKLRVILILGFLGVVGGLVLAFVTDYVITHRREIFGS
ncbi:MAG: Wzz/FepE/Etk N-terminal domain-containing protein [Candidatus Krumholzibacteriia bacterium]